MTFYIILLGFCTYVGQSRLRKSMEPQTPKYDNGKTTHKKIMERNVWTPSMGHPLDGSCRALCFDDLSEYDKHFWAWYSDFIRWKSVEPQMPKYDNAKTTHKKIMERNVWRPRMGPPPDEGGSVPFIDDGSGYGEHYWARYSDFIRGERSDRYPAVFSMDSPSTAAMFYANYMRRAQDENKMGNEGHVIDDYYERIIPDNVPYTYNSEENLRMQKPVPDSTEQIPPVGTTTSQIVCEDNDPGDISDDVWPPEFFEQEPAVYRYINQLNKEYIDQLNQKSIYQLNQKNIDQLNQKNIDQQNQMNMDQLNQNNIDQLNQKNIDQLIHDGLLMMFKEEEENQSKSTCHLTGDFWMQEMIPKCLDVEIPMAAKEWFRSNSSSVSREWFRSNASSVSREWFRSNASSMSTDEEQMMMKEGQEIQVPSSSYGEDEIPREPSMISLIGALTSLEGRRSLSRGYLMPIRPAETTPEGIAVPTGIFRGMSSCKPDYVGVPTDTKYSATSSPDQKPENVIVDTNEKTSVSDRSGNGAEDKDYVGVPKDTKCSETSSPDQKSENVIVATNEKTSASDHSGNGAEDKDYVGVPTDSKCSGTSSPDQKLENVIVATNEKTSASDHSGNGAEDKTNVSPRKKQKWYRRIFSRSKSRAPHKRK